MKKIHNIRVHILTYLRMIKFSHTVFALPFALSAVILARRQYPIAVMDIFWILLAMVGARSSAMGFNRIVDAEFDLHNPRTHRREIPAGKLSLNSARLFVFFSACIFVAAAAMLGRLCLYLSFPVLIILFFYSYTKRFTCFAHIYLGFAISLAPMGAWIALTNTFSGSILLLSLALLTYIAGFDILYACQDLEFDRKHALFSIPVRFGVKGALVISAMLHLFAFIFFLMLFIAFKMNYIYLGAVILIGILLIIEHRLVKPNDLSRVNTAFFHVNSLISVTLLIGILADELFWHWIQGF